MRSYRIRKSGLYFIVEERRVENLFKWKRERFSKFQKFASVEAAKAHIKKVKKKSCILKSLKMQLGY